MSTRPYQENPPGPEGTVHAFKALREATNELYDEVTSWDPSCPRSVPGEPVQNTADLVVLSYDLTHLAADAVDTYRAFVAGEIEGPLERKEWEHLSGVLATVEERLPVLRDRLEKARPR